MTNYSNITTDIDLKEGVLNILGGLLLFSFDFLAAMFIIARAKLRTQKEYINYFGILIYDSLFGLAFVLSWAHNISLYLNEDYIPLTSSWYCLSRIEIVFYVVTTPCTGLISLFTAIDRFIAVIFLLKYFQLGARYSFWLVIAPILITLPIFIIGAIQAYTDRDLYTVPSNCPIFSIMSLIFYYLRLIRVFATFIGVFFYIIIGIKIYFILKPSKFKTNYQQRKMIRATTTISLLITNELILIIVPDIILYIKPDTSFVGVFYLMALSKGLVNIILILIMQKEIRAEIMKIKKGIAKVKVQPLKQIIFA